MQLSLIPDLVQPQTFKAAKTTQQLSLNVLGSIATVPANTKPKQVLSTATAWYQGQICTVIKRYTEEMDGLKIKLCTIKTELGRLLEVPENHITVL